MPPGTIQSVVDFMARDSISFRGHSSLQGSKAAAASNDAQEPPLSLEGFVAQMLPLIEMEKAAEVAQASRELQSSRALLVNLNYSLPCILLWCSSVMERPILQSRCFRH